MTKSIGAKKTFKITTYGMATFEYYVEADTEEEAEEQFSLGWGEPHNDGMPTDVHDETIESVVEDA
tara:strand:- start:390 stop:587 length:198 start_codon:yes stop_codon:yes gene_type:complete